MLAPGPVHEERMTPGNERLTLELLKLVEQIGSDGPREEGWDGIANLFKLLPFASHKHETIMKGL